MAGSTRRKFALGLLGLLGTGGLAAWFTKNSIIRWALGWVHNEGLRLTAAPATGEDACVLTSSQTEGPFFISSPIRRNIKEDRRGKDLILRIQIVRMPECTPLAGAMVEIWHCDADGAYSGYPEDMAHDPWKTLWVAGTGDANVAPLTTARFLRGARQTDASGVVEFDTIFPGWYEPRSPHIHFKVLVDGGESLTSQFYFTEEFCNRIYLHVSPYSVYGSSPYTPANDIALSGYLEAHGLLLNPIWSDDAPLVASAKVGMQKSA